MIYYNDFFKVYTFFNIILFSLEYILQLYRKKIIYLITVIEIFSSSLNRFITRRLLRKRRKHRETESVVGAWEWGTAPTDDLLEIDLASLPRRPLLFPLHVPLDLRLADRDHLLQLKRDLDELRMLVSR